MGRAMRGNGDEAEIEPGTSDGDRFINAAVTIPADGLSNFYSAVAEWYEDYEKTVRGRAMRGKEEG